MKRLTCSAMTGLSFLLAACGDGGSTAAPAPGTPAAGADGVTPPAMLTELNLSVCEPATQSFGLRIDNPFLPMPEGHRLVLEGDDKGVLVRIEFDVLDKTETVAGVVTRVVAETEYKDGELYERTENYFAQAGDGTVCYFGEEVSFYENGLVVSMEGSWRAEGSNRPGIQMPGMPTINTQFYQEYAPGVAEDKSAIAQTDLAIATPAGDFTGVLGMIDWNPLEGETIDEGEQKRFAPGVGLISDRSLKLMSVRDQLTVLDLGVCDPVTQTFSLTIDNPFFPLLVGRQLVLEGNDGGELIRLEVDVLDRTIMIGPVLTRVVTETEYKDGALFERTFNYFAQAGSGAVCYFGEDVEFYENGQIIDRHGSWRADAQGNKPGIQMPANPMVDTQFYQESAPGQAEDKAAITALNATVTTPAGVFPGSVVTNDWNPLDGDSFLDAEEKSFAPGIGLIQDAAIRLTSMR